MEDTACDIVNQERCECQVATALEYLQMGLVPLPVCSTSAGVCIFHGPRCLHPGKVALTSWPKRAPSTKQIKRWFSRKFRHANVAILTGRISGVCVLDVDCSTAQLGGVSPTPIAVTGRGFHVYFRYSKRFGKTQTLKSIGEWRADGAYVVVPDSKHISGFLYTWAIPPEWEAPVQIPDWLAKKLTGRRGRYTARDVIGGVPEGFRNVSSTKVAGKLLGALSPNDWDLAWILLKAWNAQNKPPLPEGELRAVFDSIVRRELEKRSKPSAERKLLHVLAEQFSLRELSELSGIPRSTLSDMFRTLFAKKAPSELNFSGKSVRTPIYRENRGGARGV